jgi:membrane-associated HD superfamily phosphohydrolase
MKEFKIMVLENKDISELYYIYDDLSTNKGLDKDLAEDYLNESLEYSQILISSSKNIINRLDTWVSKYIKESKNNYRDIDNAIYNKSIRNLESILESKNTIKKTLISENKKSELTIQETNLPISSMVKIANETLKKEISLNESEQKELNEILSLNGDDLKEEFVKTKKIVLDNLKNSINESKDSDLNNTISKTIEKIKESKCDHYEYYKLKKLSLGL